MKERGDVSHDDIPSAYYCSSSSSSLTSRVDRASLFIGLTRYVNDERVAGRKARRRLLLSFFLHRLVCNSVTRAAAETRDLFGGKRNSKTFRITQANLETCSDRQVILKQVKNK